MKILLANPRGFCAGVDRAIEIVERALEMGEPFFQPIEEPVLKDAEISDHNETDDDQDFDQREARLSPTSFCAVKMHFHGPALERNLSHHALPEPAAGVPPGGAGRL